MAQRVQQPTDSDRGMRRAASRRTARPVWRAATAALIVCCALLAPAADATGPTPTPNPADVIRVKLLNALTAQVLPGVTISAKRKNGDSYSWVANRTTDATGWTSFVLPGLGAGVRYAFTVTPYNGGTVQSEDVTQVLMYKFRVGTIAA
jgi:hypothetical protein